MSPIVIENRGRGPAALSAAFLALALLCCAVSHADGDEGDPQVREARDSDEIALPSARRMAQDERLRKLISRSHRGLEITRGPRGEMSMHLDGRFHSVSTAHIGPDGKLHVNCHDDHDDLQRALHGLGVPESGEAAVRESASDAR